MYASPADNARSLELAAKKKRIYNETLWWEQFKRFATICSKIAKFRQTTCQKTESTVASGGVVAVSSAERVLEKFLMKIFFSLFFFWRLPLFFRTFVNVFWYSIQIVFTFLRELFRHVLALHEFWFIIWNAIEYLVNIFTQNINVKIILADMKWES